MAKTFDKLLEQKPSFIQQGEPISGSSSPLTQDATVLADGTIISTLEGVNNRVPSHLWGSIKLLVELLRKQHENDGSHSLDNSAFADDADIAESKLALDLKEIDKPDGSGLYTSTAELAAFVATLWPIIDTAAASSYYSTNNVTNVITSTQAAIPVFWTYPTTGNDTTVSDLGGTQDGCVVANGEVVVIGGNKIILSNVNSLTDQCILNLGRPHNYDQRSENITPTQIVVLEMWTHNITGSGFGFVNGNTQYKNTNVTDGSEGLSYPHTDQFVEVDSPGFQDFLFNIDNNIFLDKDYTFKQRVWALNVRNFDYAAYKNGCDDASYRTYMGNKAVTKSTLYDGCWQSNDGLVVLVPMLMIARRNAGVYNKFLNPGGQAIKRRGVTNVGYIDCFYRDWIGYFTAEGVECPDYSTAVYDAVTDVYTRSGTTYYRSGTAGTTARASYIAGAKIEDIIPEYDIISLKRTLVSPEEAVHSAEQIILSGNTQALEFRSIEYGKVGDLRKSTFFSKKPPQIIGFATTEVGIFGSGNLGGVLVDICNNNQTGVIDNVRKVWTDRRVTAIVEFKMTQGNSASESKPNMLAYEPNSRTITLNTNNLSGSPIVHNDYTPILTWDTGETVLLETGWSGLVTATASVTLTAADHAAHSGRVIHGIGYLDYQLGAGVPYIISNISSILGTDNVAYNWFHDAEKKYYLEFTYDGALTGTPTTTVMSLGGLPFNTNGFYVDQYATILLTGETRKITAYNGVTKAITLETALSSAPAAATRIVIHTINQNTQPYMHIDKLGRGILGNVKRTRYLATTVTVGGAQVGVVTPSKVIHKVSVGSLGSVPVIKGSVITGLQVGEYVDVLYESNTPFETGFMVAATQIKSNNLFASISQTDSYRISSVGSLFSTNIGSANHPESAYREFIPCATIPCSAVKWVGSTTSKLISSLTNMRNIAWAQVAPFEGMVLDASTMTVSFKYFTEEAYLVSVAQVVHQNSGCHVGFLLAKSLNTGRPVLLVGVSYDKNFGFDSVNNVYVVDINKIFAIKE